MGTLRTNLTIHEGGFRSFEWFWDDDDSMPGLDAYELLTLRDQNDFWHASSTGAISAPV